jgi:hypothetical protein
MKQQYLIQFKVPIKIAGSTHNDFSPDRRADTKMERTASGFLFTRHYEQQGEPAEEIVEVPWSNVAQITTRGPRPESKVGGKPR